MSIESTVNVTCPHCKEEQPFTIWTSINTSLDPEMKEAVRNLSAFLFECSKCGEKHYFDYGFLYHQMEDRILIQYVQSDEEEKEAFQMLTGDDSSGVMKAFRKDKYLIRIVRSQNELREKLAIFDAGLDDRIVELYKILVLASIHRQNPDFKTILLYYLKDQGENCIQVFADDEYRGTLLISEELFGRLKDDYESKLPDLREEEPIINRQWAIKMMNG